MTICISLRMKDVPGGLKIQFFMVSCLKTFDYPTANVRIRVTKV